MPGGDPSRARPPQKGGRAVRVGTLLLLVAVVLIAALSMVVSFIDFVVKPDPSVRAGPMYVTLTLTTVATVLMLVMALNATFVPLMSRANAASLQLVSWAMGITGSVTGLLTVGRPAGPLVWRFALAAIAFMFISRQNVRLTRARAAAPPASQATSAGQVPAHRRGRQRRGGRKRQ